MATYNDKKKKAAAPSSGGITKGGVSVNKSVSRPSAYQPEARKANAEMERHVQQRPSVTPSNQVRYSDPSKRFEKEFGVGAKLAAPGTQLRAQQDAAARQKVGDFKQQKGFYPVEDVNRPVTKGGVMVDKDNTPMPNRTIDRLTGGKK